MEHENESPFIDLGDNTALVCVDHQQYQKIIVPQLIDMTYKVHLGLFEEDVLLKLKTYNYDVVVIFEVPSNVNAAAVSMAIMGSGAVKDLKTSALMSPDEGFDAMLLAQGAGYRPPGS